MANPFQRRAVFGTAILFIFILFYVYRTSPLLSYHTLDNIKRANATSFHMPTYSLEESSSFTFASESPIVRAYLNVVRDTVCGLTLRTREMAVDGDLKNLRPLNMDMRLKGLDWPLIGITMVGQRRLINIEWALRRVIAMNVPGDFIECGVWRGGSSVFARAVLKALNDQNRHVWLADSFQGLPKARTANDDDSWSRQEYLKV